MFPPRDHDEPRLLSISRSSRSVEVWKSFQDPAAISLSPYLNGIHGDFKHASRKDLGRNMRFDPFNNTVEPHYLATPFIRPVVPRPFLVNFSVNNHIKTVTPLIRPLWDSPKGGLIN